MTHAENPRSARQLIRGGPYALTFLVADRTIVQPPQGQKLLHWLEARGGDLVG